MNLWKVGFRDEDKEIDITLIVRCDTLDSILSLSYEIAEKRNIKLKFISQNFLDFRGGVQLKEKDVNAF